MEEISLKADSLFKIGNYIITNSLLLSAVVFVTLVIFSYFIKKYAALIPSKIQSACEMAFEALLDLMESILGSRNAAIKYFPLIATIFIFILTSNLMGVLPGVGSFFLESHGKEVALFRSPASDLNFTLAIAVISVITTNLFGIITLGFFKHIGKFLNFKDPISFFIGILELISEIAKVISLSFRLFGNVFAGEVLLTIVFFLMPYLVPLPFLFLEIFVGFIQAFVFAMLTLVSIAIHTADHEAH